MRVSLTFEYALCYNKCIKIHKKYTNSKPILAKFIHMKKQLKGSMPKTSYLVDL